MTWRFGGREPKAGPSSWAPHLEDPCSLTSRVLNPRAGVRVSSFPPTNDALLRGPYRPLRMAPFAGAPGATFGATSWERRW